MKQNKFLQHIRPNLSCLEQWRAEITAMRKQNWPYARIKKWLLDTHGLKISDTAIRKFCNSRGIVKGEPSPGPANRPNRVFEYDDTKPIQRQHQ